MVVNPTRRTVARAAVWAAPAVVVASVAPAFAASGQGTLTFRPGTSFVQEGIFDEKAYFDLYLMGASVTASNGPAGSASLTMTVTFVPDFGWSDIYYYTGPASWQTAAPSGATGVATLYFTYPGGIESGQQVPVVGDPVLGTNVLNVTGTFQFTFSAPGYSQATYSFSTADAAPLALRRSVAARGATTRG